jgi:ring-1,2-phenylacetyl-CoA epoxidase subunit PaaE
MFYKLKVKDIKRETADCVSIALEIPEAIATEFAFHQGQYLTLRADINGEDIRRSYSICSAPQEGELRVAVKEVEAGKFSNYANRVLKTGDILEAMPPMGHFFSPLDAKQQKHYLFFAAGSGITPVISNIKAILYAEPLSYCTLVYGNRNTSSIIFKESLAALKNQFLSRLRLFNVLSRERTEFDLLYGRLDREKIALFFDKMPDLLQSDAFFACGPNEMMEAVQAVLSAHQIAPEKIHVELFNAPKNGATSKKEIKSAVHAQALIKLNGLTFEVPVEKGQAILDAAQQTGADMPYACKGGVCCTCRAKLIEGAVEMFANYALTKEEIEQHFILTCQAVPKSARIMVDFDIK